MDESKNHNVGQRKRKQHRIDGRIQRGERLGLLVQSLPLPWQMQPILCGPFLFPVGQWTDRHLRNQAHARMRALPHTQAPRWVSGVVPGFKRLRAALIDAVKGMGDVGIVVVADVIACWGRQPDSGTCIVDLTEPLSTGPYRDGTCMFLNEMRRRMVRHIQALRAVSHANGGWWPAPECMQVLLDSDGSISARMRFAKGYQPPGQAWLEFSDRGRGWRRCIDAGR